MFPFLLAVFEPESIRKQMVFQRWIMLKMFLTAIASGACIFFTLEIVGCIFVYVYVCSKYQRVNTFT